MKKIILFTFSLIACVSVAIAQPTIVAADVSPVVGDIYYDHGCDITGVSVGTGGAGLTWDFHTLVSTLVDTTSIVSCSSTAYCDSFPLASVVEKNGNGIVYTYLLENATSVYVLGIAQPATPHIINYSTNMWGDGNIFFPFTYGTTGNDTFSGGAPSFTSRFYGTSHVNCDAYGTLILPSGTYTNVARLHAVVIQTDSSYYSSTWHITTYQTEIYCWYAHGYHIPLLRMSLDTPGGSLSLSQVIYYTQSTLSEIEPVNNTIQCKIYPNPASDEVNVSFNLSDTKNTTVSLLDCTGRILWQTKGETLLPGKNNISIPVSSFSPGVYLIRLQNSENAVTQKIVISR